MLPSPCVLEARPLSRFHSLRCSRCCLCTFYDRQSLLHSTAVTALTSAVALNIASAFLVSDAIYLPALTAPFVHYSLPISLLSGACDTLLPCSSCCALCRKCSCHCREPPPDPATSACPRLVASLAEVIFMPYFYASCCVFSLCACCATQSCCRVWGAGFNSNPNPSSMIRFFLTQDPNKASARNLPLSHTDQRMFFLGRVISVREPWAFLFF